MLTKGKGLMLRRVVEEKFAPSSTTHSTSQTASAARPTQSSALGEERRVDEGPCR